MEELSKEVIDKYKEAGKIAHTCLNNGAKLIKVGASMREVLDSIENNIKQMGGKIAFPAQIALNNIAAHYCPTDEEDENFSVGDIAKLDIGVHVDGYVADTAMSVNLGSHDDLLKASRDALNSALKMMTPGTKLGIIGRTIQETIQSYNLSPIRNLSGHGLRRFEIHTKPNIPNVDTKDETVLEEGMVVAVEPFASTGAGIIYESSNPSIFTLRQIKPTRSPITRSVLQSIKEFQGLPFTTRWLTKIHGLGKTRFALRELEQNGSLLTHPPLPDKEGGFVSQHEHSVIVKNKPIIYTKED